MNTLTERGNRITGPKPPLGAVKITTSKRITYFEGELKIRTPGEIRGKTQEWFSEIRYLSHLR
jgi:hypothetical protein